MYEPLDPSGADKAFISKSMDATTHFESCGEDILSLYRRIMGKDYDYEAVAPEAPLQPSQGMKHQQPSWMQSI